MHNSYSERAMTASIVNYCLTRHSVCVSVDSVTRTTLTPEQVTVELCFGLVMSVVCIVRVVSVF